MGGASSGICYRCYRCLYLQHSTLLAIALKRNRPFQVNGFRKAGPTIPSKFENKIFLVNADKHERVFFHSHAALNPGNI